MLMGQFKRSEPQYVEAHFNDVEVKDRRKASVITDSYELTRCALPGRGRLGKQENKQAGDSQISVGFTDILCGLPVQLVDGLTGRFTTIRL